VAVGVSEVAEISVAADVSAAADAPRIETGPGTVCPTLTIAVVSLVADIVAVWLNVATEAAELQVAEALVAAESSAAGSVYFGPESIGLNPG